MNRTTDHIQRFLHPFLFTALAIFIFFSAFQKQRWDTDIFWALKSGEWIVENLQVPREDPFSYTFRGREWIDFTWGFQVIAHIFFIYLGGWTGLFMLQLIVTSLTFYFIYLNLRLLAPKRTELLLAILFLVFITSFPRLFIRPHLFSYLFISLYLLLLNLHEKEGKARYLYLLLPLQVLWVNIHSSFILGIFITGAYYLGKLIDDVREKGLKGEVFLGGGGRLLFIALLLPLVSLINPYGIRLVVFPFIHQSPDNADALRHIGEWIRLPLKDLLFYLYPFPINLFAFRILLLGAVLCIALNIRYLKTRDIFILASAIYMASMHMRWIAQFAYLVAPLIACNLSSYLDRKGTGLHGFVPLNLLLSIVIFLDLFVWTDLSIYGLGLKGSAYPEGTVRFMKREGIKGNIFNEYIFGGYLIHTYPDVPVFIDGRTPTVYSPYFFWTTRLAREERYWDKIVDEYDIEIALIKHKSKLCSNLWKDSRWVAVSFDDVSVLYLRDGERYRDIISKWGLRFTNPCSDAKRYELPEEKEALDGMMTELERIILQDGDYARPHRLMGLVRSRLGDGEGALRDFKKAVEIKNDPLIHYDLALTLVGLERYDEAVETLKRVIKEDKDFKDAYLSLGLVYHKKGDHRKAVKILKRYVELADDGSKPEAYKYLGRSCFELSMYKCAVTYLKRATFTLSEPGELAEMHYFTGNALLELKRYREAEHHYRRAVALKPEYVGVLERLAGYLRDRTDRRDVILRILRDKN